MNNADELWTDVGADGSDKAVEGGMTQKERKAHGYWKMRNKSVQVVKSIDDFSV